MAVQYSIKTLFGAVQKYILVLLSSIVILSANSASAGIDTKIKENNMAPNFTLKSILGDNLRLSEYRGQIVLINFWASWCAPCRQEMPALEALYQEYKDIGFTIFGINVDNEQEKGIAAAAQANVNFPILFDANKQVSEKYDVQAMPTTVVVGRDGTVQYVHLGYKPGDEATYAKKLRMIIKSAR